MKLYKILKEGEIIESPIPGEYAGYKKGKIFGRLDCKTGMRMKKRKQGFLSYIRRCSKGKDTARA